MVHRGVHGLMFKRHDHKGVVHYAKRTTSVFSLCTGPRPQEQDFLVSLAWPGNVPDEQLVNCLQCIVAIGEQHG